MEHVERIERLFEHLAFIATSWLYAGSGFIVGEIIAGPEIQGVDWGSLFILYLWLNIVRFVMILLFYPVLKRIGYGFSLREACLLAFGGLRGAVGLTLGLFIKDRLTAAGDVRGAALTEFFMAGSILLLIINAVLAPYFLRLLRLESKPNESLMDALQQKMAEEVVDMLSNTGVPYEQATYLGESTMMFSVSPRLLTFQKIKHLGKPPMISKFLVADSYYRLKIRLYSLQI